MASQSVQSLDLHNFMDVITSYKCKFCSFNCEYPQGIASHVRHVHLQEGDLATELRPPDNEMIPVATVSTAAGPDGDQDMQELTPNEEAKDSAMAVALLSQPELENELQEPGVEMQSITKESSDIAAQYAEIVQEATQCMVSDGTITQQSAAEVAQAACSLEEAGDTSGQKELFLCGQCGAAFGSIDDCKQHMIDEHNVSVPGDSESNFVTKDSATHIDASTQVIPKKRPGRKRKIKDTSPKVIINPLYKKPVDDKDNEPMVETENIGKRRIRVPKALKEDYCLNKRVKIRRKTREMNKPFDLNCKYPNCLARFQLIASLKIHESCHNVNQGQPGFNCVECSTYFLQWRTLRMHLWKEHKIDTDLYSCNAEDCNFKTDKVYKLNIHREIHSAKRPYNCDQCTKSFKQLNQLRNHQVIHLDKNADPLSDKWYNSKTCKICKRSFANVKCLNTHIEAVHTKLKPFICQFCGHTAARKAMLQLHLRTHTGEKPFKCDQCTYTTGDHNSLRRHYMRHTGQKPYQCQFCSYACIQAISLKTHMKNKHPGSEGVFACTMCTYVSVNKTSLDNHLEDHKNGLIEVQPRQARPNTTQNLVSAAEGQQTGKTLLVQQDEEVPQQLAVATTDMDGGFQTHFSSDTCAAELIYSALNAIQQSQKESSSTITVGGMQATVTDNAATGGVGHTITFHVPTGVDSAGSNPVVLVQQPPSQVDRNAEDAIAVAYNTNNIQSSFDGQVPETEGIILTQDSGVSEQMDDSSDLVRTEGDITSSARAATEDLLNHAATMVALRGDQEIVSLAAESANLPMQDDDTGNVMEAHFVQISPNERNILQSADGMQFVQVVTPEGHPTDAVLQLGSTENGTPVLQTIPVASIADDTEMVQQ